MDVRPTRISTIGVASPPPHVFGVSAEEWQLLGEARPNLLLVGNEAITSAFLRALWPTLQEPVWLTTAAPFSLPSLPPGTLIVQNGSGLTAEDQAQLLQWLSEHQRGVQLITTTPKPLAPLVVLGAFLETLYYRLNVMYLELEIDQDARGDLAGV